MSFACDGWSRQDPAQTATACQNGNAPPPPPPPLGGVSRRQVPQVAVSSPSASQPLVTVAVPMRVRRNHRECRAIVGSNGQWRGRVGRHRSAGDRNAITEPLVGNRTRTRHLGGKRCGLTLERGCVLWLPKNDRRCHRCRRTHGGIGIQQAGTALPHQSTGGTGTSSRMRARC